MTEKQGKLDKREVNTKIFKCLKAYYRAIPESLHLCIPLNFWWETVNFFWFLGNLADAAFYESSFALQ